MTEPDEARLQSSARAFMAARCRASVAEYETRHLLHMAIYDARECGLSVRATAQLLRVPKSTIARHWLAERARDLGMNTDLDDPPIWGTVEEFMDAQRAIWAHDPTQIGECPFVWTEQADGSRRITYRIQSGPAILDEAASVPRWDATFYIDRLARRVLERLHPEVPLTPEVLDAARAAVSKDIVGATAILEDALQDFDPARQADLRTRRARGYYLGEQA